MVIKETLIVNIVVITAVLDMKFKASFIVHVLSFFHCCNMKLSYRRGTERYIVSVEILQIATQQCRNYLYDKS